MVQIHKQFNDIQVKELIERYIAKKIGRKYVQETHRISPATERNIVKELKKEKELIENKNTPIKQYNYSYLQDLLEQDYQQKASLPTIIDRARRNHCYFPRAKRKVHDREVLTHYPELI